MMDVLFYLIFLLFVVAPVGTTIHESGHAIGAMLVKADNIKLSIGLGKEIITFTLGNIQITIHTFFFLGGFVQSDRTPSYRPIETVWITAFGSINNVFFAILFYLFLFI